MTHADKLPDFDHPQLAAKVEALSPEDIDRLAFGAIRLDDAGMVLSYSRTERRQSGFGDRAALGLNFFSKIAPCMDNDHFRGRLERARASGTLDIELSHIGDFQNAEQELVIRILSAAAGGYWIFIRREE